MTTQQPRKQRAPRIRLTDGQDSINHTRVSTRVDKSGNTYRALDWRIRVEGQSKTITRRTQGGANESDKVIRLRAKETADEMRRAASLVAGLDDRWKPTSAIGDFIDEVVAPAIQNGDYSDLTKSRYAISLAQLRGQCSNHKHQFALDRLTIKTATSYITLESCLMEIARLHGAETARQARNIVSGHIIKNLQRYSLVPGNVLLSSKIDLKTGAKINDSGRKGGLALSPDEYRRAVEYLLALDPADGVAGPKKGRWTIQDSIAKRRNAIDMTLLQAGSGLRISEGRRVRVPLFEQAGNHLAINLTKKEAKGGIERKSFILNEQIADHIGSRLDRLSDTDYVVGAPSDDSKQWQPKACSNAVANLYIEMRDVLGIEAFTHQRSHTWRATLNTMLLGTVPESMRAAQFGHTTDVNKRSYTDAALTPDFVESSKNFFNTH